MALVPFDDLLKTARAGEGRCYGINDAFDFIRFAKQDVGSETRQNGQCEDKCNSGFSG